MKDDELDKELSEALSRKVGGSDIASVDIPLPSAKKSKRSTYTAKKNKYKPQPMTYKELREKQKIAETANLGPGGDSVLKPFGSDLKTKINFGSKYEFKPDNNPGFGDYNIESGMRLIKPKIFEVIMSKEKKKKTPIDPKK